MIAKSPVFFFSSDLPCTSLVTGGRFRYVEWAPESRLDELCFLSGRETIAPNLISPKFSTPSCWACIKTCRRDRLVSSFFAASSALISNSFPFLPLSSTVVVLRLEILSLASDLPSSVNCHVF